MTHWNNEIIASVSEDFGAEHIVTRAAKRIANKGFSLVDVKVQPGLREGFNWGRSSHGVTNNTIWTVTFEDDANQEFSICISGAVTTYTKANPYDKIPANHNKLSFAVRATDDVKKVLGWQGA